VDRSSHWLDSVEQADETGASGWIRATDAIIANGQA